MAHSSKNTQPASYSGLDFSFKDLLTELCYLYSLAEEFLTPESQWRWKSWTSELQQFQSSKSKGAWDWQTAQAIETVAAEEYEPNGGSCAFEVHGSLSAIWTVKLTERKNPRTFRLLGKASTKLCIMEGQPGKKGRKLAEWQIEIGDDASPGCHFHIGIGQQESEHMFPKGLCVPRLPCLLITPTDSLDFLLGELFQDRWSKRVGEDTTAAQSFGSPQKARMSQLLNWKSATVNGSSGSAWNHLKRARPLEAGTFLSK